MMAASVFSEGRQRTVLLSVAALLLATALAASGWLLGRTTLPTELATPSAIENVDVAYQDFDDARTADLAVKLQDSPGLVARGAGLLTGSTCTPGGAIMSGGATFILDRVPLLDLATAQPLARTLVMDDRGADVSELQQAFAALGYTGAVDGVVGTRTIAFFNALRRGLVADAPRVDAIDPASIVWMPSSPAEIVTCPISVGSSVEPGATLAELPPAIASLRVRTLPTAVPSSARTLLIDGIVANVEEDGTVDAAAWPKIAATPTFRDYLTDPEKVVLSGSVQLAEPIRVAQVPPSALFGVGDDTACVSDATTVYRGTVVSSERGYTLVDFSDPEPEIVSLLPNPRRQCP